MKIKKILYFLDFPHAFGGATNTLLKQAVLMKKYAQDILITIPLDNHGDVIDEYVRHWRRYL